MGRLASLTENPGNQCLDVHWPDFRRVYLNNFKEKYTLSLPYSALEPDSGGPPYNTPAGRRCTGQIKNAPAPSKHHF